MRRSKILLPLTQTSSGLWNSTVRVTQGRNTISQRVEKSPNRCWCRVGLPGLVLLILFLIWINNRNTARRRTDCLVIAWRNCILPKVSSCSNSRGEHGWWRKWRPPDSCTWGTTQRGGHSPAYEALSGQARENEGDRSRLVRTDQHSVSWRKEGQGYKIL